MKSIMLITSYSLMRSGLRRLLETELNSKVETVGDDPKVLYAQLLLEYDIVIFDTSVKNISCIELLRFLRQYSLCSKVLVFSFSLEHSDLINFLVQGASGYLTIDADPKDLLTAIQVVSEGKIYVHSSYLTSLAKEIKSISKKNSSIKGRQKMQKTVSTRELNILFLIVNGFSQREIAKKLKINEQSVTNNISRICKKLKVSNYIEAFLVALTNNLLE